jgi:hypothetical protein
VSAVGVLDACDDITGIDVAILEKGFIKPQYVLIDEDTSASLALMAAPRVI